MKRKALKECDQYTSKYAQCAAGKTISIVRQCRKQAKELNNCLRQFTNDAVLEEMKKEYMLHENQKGTSRV
ncbi:14-3-3-like protein-like isoform X1 [Hibiscus syriacus]|uniref:COX assembly mitochondrial protein n=2 Tax=Hibiscus syriacus TaxID=106335 RepID=A0A6A2Y8B6_HIBSY|nr:14-3-3-like protein-like isoform X1 [Hibiscus syriacus]